MRERAGNTQLPRVFAEVPAINGDVVSLESGDVHATYWLSIEAADTRGITAHMTVQQLRHLYVEIGHALSM